MSAGARVAIFVALLAAIFAVAALAGRALHPDAAPHRATASAHRATAAEQAASALAAPHRATAAVHAARGDIAL
jgi:hypothetical protein